MCCWSTVRCDLWSRSHREAVTVRGKRKFWQFRAAADDPKVGELLLYGEISDFTWWGDEVTPRQFREDLEALGDIDELRVTSTVPVATCSPAKPSFRPSSGTRRERWSTLTDWRRRRPALWQWRAMSFGCLETP